MSEDKPTSAVSGDHHDVVEHITVPLVVYGQHGRKVIGEATISGEQIKAKLGPDVGEELISQLFRGGIEFTSYLPWGAHRDRLERSELDSLGFKVGKPEMIIPKREFDENIPYRLKSYPFLEQPPRQRPQADDSES